MSSRCIIRLESRTLDLVAPGEPDRSVLLYRVARRGPGQMPQLATSRPDEPAVEMLRQWILEMKKIEVTLTVH